MRRRRDLSPDVVDAAVAAEEDAIAVYVKRRLTLMLLPTDPPHPLLPRQQSELSRILATGAPVAERVGMMIDVYDRMGLGEAALSTAERAERSWRETEGRPWLWRRARA